MDVKKEHGFLQQSSWMVITTFVGGILMTLVHTVSSKMDGSGKSGEGEYSTFVTLLRLLITLEFRRWRCNRSSPGKRPR